MTNHRFSPLIASASAVLTLIPLILSLGHGTSRDLPASLGEQSSIEAVTGRA